MFCECFCNLCCKFFCWRLGSVSTPAQLCLSPILEQGFLIPESPFISSFSISHPLSLCHSSSHWTGETSPADQPVPSLICHGAAPASARGGATCKCVGGWRALSGGCAGEHATVATARTLQSPPQANDGASTAVGSAHHLFNQMRARWARHCSDLTFVDIFCFFCVQFNSPRRLDNARQIRAVKSAAPEATAIWQQNTLRFGQEIFSRPKQGTNRMQICRSQRHPNVPVFCQTPSNHKTFLHRKKNLPVSFTTHQP